MADKSIKISEEHHQKLLNFCMEEARKKSISLHGLMKKKIEEMIDEMTDKK